MSATSSHSDSLVDDSATVQQQTDIFSTPKKEPQFDNAVPSTSVEAHTEEEDEVTSIDENNNNLIPPNSKTKQDDEAIGVTSSGERFRVPETYDCIETLFDVQKWIEKPVTVEVGLLFFYFFVLYMGFPSWFFLLNFVFWRLCYNVGLGYILHRQSQDRWFTNLVSSYMLKYHKDWFEANVSTKEDTKVEHGKRFDTSKYPIDFSAWMAYRAVVDIILSSDLTTYFAFCFAYLEIPNTFGLLDVFLYILGALLMIFNLWAKSDAHRVLGDYAWYWGDFFFLLDKNLIFDGIFQMFPHPMYTVGYSFYYGMSIITRSYTVLIVSFAAHMLQLTFLTVVENPHIEKTYGAMVTNHTDEQTQILNNYFDKKRELVVFANLDLFKASDLLLLLLSAYTLVNGVVYSSSVSNLYPVLQYLFWRGVHSIGLGTILKKQSEAQFWTKHWTQNNRTKIEAFENWKKLYNTSLTMNYITFIVCAYQLLQDASLFSLPFIARCLVGSALIALNIWASSSCYEVLGHFGWFYGDFFIEEYPTQLYYGGIYRYLNNPDLVFGFAAYYGLAIISGSWTMFALAIASQCSNYLFVKLVEKPHMQNKYGAENLRRSGGISSQIRQNLTRVRSNPKFKSWEYKLNAIKEEIEGIQKKMKDSNQNGSIAQSPSKAKISEEVKEFIQKTFEILKKQD